MPRNPAKDLAAALDTALASLTLDTNLFVGPEREVSDEEVSPVPAQAVFVMNAGGPPPEPYLSAGSTSYKRANVQIKIRSNPDEWNAGESLAFDVLGAAHLATVSGYVQCLARQPTPVPFEQDKANRWVWVINVQMEHEE